MLIWILFIVAILGILLLLWNAYTGIASAFWPVTKGRVLGSFVEKRKNTASSSKHRYYHPVIHYEYHVQGRCYRSKRIGNFLAFGGDEAFAKNIVSTFSEGHDVKVYYFPVNPKVSALVSGVQQIWAHLILLSTGAMLILACIPVLFTENPYAFVDYVMGLVHRLMSLF